MSRLCLFKNKSEITRRNKTDQESVSNHHVLISEEGHDEKELNDIQLKIMKQQQSALSEWINCGLTGTCDDARTARGEPSHIVTLAKQHALCQ